MREGMSYFLERERICMYCEIMSSELLVCLGKKKKTRGKIKWVWANKAG